VDPNPTDPIETPSESGLLSDPEIAGAPDSAASADRPAATEVVVAARPAAPGGSRARWLIGGGVAVAALAGLVLAATFLGARPLPDALKYLPADSAIVIELRPELPGDQRQHFGNFLAHFPGFEDQSTLDAKLDETLDRITREASGGGVDYATQVKPLLAGPIAISVTPDALMAMASGGTHPDAGILAVATTDGGVSCDDVFGTTSSDSTYREVDIRTVDAEVACAVHGRYLLVGPAASIRGGIDARLDGGGVDGSATYQSARAKLEGDQLASIFLDAGALANVLQDMAGAAGQDLPGGLAGTWLIEGLHVTDDALILDAYGPAASAGATPSGSPTVAPAAESRFAEVLPADTIGFVEVHGVGALVERALAGLRADPAQADAIQSLEAALAAVGGTDNLVSWIEDAGIAILPNGDAAGGAVLIRGADADAAAARVAQIRNLLVLASTGTDITLHDTDHGGVTITTVDLGDLSTLLGQLGAPGTDVGDARLSFSMAARDDLVVIAVGDGLVERILDVDQGSSLAASSTYGRVIEIAGRRNDGQVYVGLDSTLALVEGLLPPDQLGTWSSELKPYLDHLGGAALTSTTSSTGFHGRGVLTVK
jgi:Protein of unknown function (DUF3352)